MAAYQKIHVSEFLELNEDQAMATSEFDAFVQRQQAKKRDSNEFDAKRQLDEWRVHLSELYRMVEVNMQTYIDTGAATIEYTPLEINEEFSGPYEVNEMFLTIGPSVIRFKPIGTMLIGSKGRVDVEGPHSTARLVLVNRKISEPRQLIRVSISMNGRPEAPVSLQNDDHIEWAWKIVTPAPNIRFIDLDEATFFDMILMVADA
ncbi:hypothetical protein M2360_003794 [Rhizobium sp. SG_E_25_P2]|uniref:hypothetical protein n=1 Tax=Rhizobium sp. SG_E_25_P2 TaxID=2879942 RepID=UPI0024740E54|nr:hypothetical protein [Rhizobium sp. SG_E_25_P2]MDH6268389.1 hypothetical protein [Rhizobium sp. SG_E_25_P2]